MAAWIYLVAVLRLIAVRVAQSKVYARPGAEMDTVTELDKPDTHSLSRKLEQVCTNGCADLQQGQRQLFLGFKMAKSNLNWSRLVLMVVQIFTGTVVSGLFLDYEEKPGQNLRPDEYFGLCWNLGGDLFAEATCFLDFREDSLSILETGACSQRQFVSLTSTREKLRRTLGYKNGQVCSGGLFLGFGRRPSKIMDPIGTGIIDFLSQVQYVFRLVECFATDRVQRTVLQRRGEKVFNKQM